MTRFKLYLFASLAFLILASYLLWRHTVCCSDLGLNLFSELISITITIIVIERLIHKIKENDNLPLQIAMYNEVNRFTSAQIRLLQDLFQKSIIDDEPDNLDQLLNSETAKRMWHCINMESTPLVLPKTDMWTYLSSEVTNFNKAGNEILNRYSGHLDPKVHLLIHDLTNSVLMMVLRTALSIRSHDVKQQIPRPTVLTSYSIDPPQKYFDDLLSLHNWCSEFYKRNKKSSSVSVCFIYQKFSGNRNLIYRKDPVQLQKEMAIYAAFQGKTSM